MRTQASYRIFGPDPTRTAANVTAALSMGPFVSYEVGEKPRPRSPVAANSFWCLSSGEGPDDDVELSVQLRRLLDVLLPRTEQLWQLNRGGYVMDWFCYLGSYATEHAAEVSRDLMHDLLLLPGEVLLDIYGGDDEP